MPDRLAIKRRACLSLLLAAPAWAVAQAWPSKPVRIVVPFAPGGPADVLGRLAAQALSESLRQSVVVDNRTGAGGTIGVDAIARSAADGYTLGVVPVGNIAVNPTLVPNLPYQAADLTPVAVLATAENVLVVSSDVPVRSLKELLDLAARKPGALSFASPGPGSQAHLAGELLKVSRQIFVVHVPYRGIAPAVNGVVGGQVTMMFAPLATALPHIRSGKLRALGLASGKRSALVPDLPTIAEQGVPNFEAVSWYALMAPTGTPADIVTRLHADTGRALAGADVKEKLVALGMEPSAATPQQIAATIQAETGRWAAVIRQQRLRSE